ncbi:MAG TPA: NAD(P)-binding domain-containing protein [Hyphomicrobiaceae bacterium]|nr:NAD(P)-binding domain-containing protein [Hyphomicrobiaceae bacterium]
MPKSIGIIGAGAGGLTGAKHMLEAGADVTIYEIGSHVGGLWGYQNDNKRSSAYKTLHINTARDLTAFADHPFPKTVQPFPDHRDMAAYLKSYAEHFGLMRLIRFNTPVRDVRPAPGYRAEAPRWRLTLGNGETVEHDAVIVASGHLTKRLDVADFKEKFTGEYLHSHDYKDPARFAGKRICIVGVGNSALDIASDVCSAAESCVLVARSRPLIIPKLIFGRPFWDVIRPFYHPWVPAAVRNRVLKALVWTVHGDMGRLGFPAQSQKIHATSNANIVNHIQYRRVLVKQGIERIAGRVVHFVDGTSEEFDTFIAATGYVLDLDFIPKEVVPIRNNGLDLYMRIVPPDWRGLYFLGFFNSDTAANWIMEGQIRWLREFELGRAALPGKDVMMASIEARRYRVLRDFKDTPRHEIEVEHLPYFRELKTTLAEGLQRVGAKPRDVGIGAKGQVPKFAPA